MNKLHVAIFAAALALTAAPAFGDEAPVRPIGADARRAAPVQAKQARPLTPNVDEPKAVDAAVSHDSWRVSGNTGADETSCAGPCARRERAVAVAQSRARPGKMLAQVVNGIQNAGAHVTQS